MSDQKIPFEMSREIPVIQRNSGTRDFSRTSCEQRAYVVRDTTRTVNMLGRSLRLNPISRTPLPTKMPEVETQSYYQRMQLEAEGDERAN
jgi:hypothetical protein